jgi:hypothetical protein
MEIEPSASCTPSNSFFSIPFPSSRPILKASLDCPCSPPVEASVLFDSGASASFIDFKFACRNRLQLSPLTHPIQCRGFDGTLAKSGNIHTYWRGRIHFPLKAQPSQFSPVFLFVTNLASANIILCFPWLSKNHTFVGGSPRALLVPKSLGLSEISVQDLPPEIMQFSDVFVTNSLSCRPPH